ncbi:MAG: hypothetical protein JWM97_1892 [Phycisphaerales bacterium]|nr:hypothetical protein [Phycisphaerales bacterium]
MGSIMAGNEMAAPDAGEKASRAEVQKPGSETEAELSPAKLAVLRELAGGSGVATAARAVGVDRHTVYRWMRKDPEFIAALNAWRNQSVQWAREQMVAVLDEAAATVRHAIRNGNVNVAMEVLKRQGALDKIVERCDDPNEIGKVSHIQRREGELELKKKMVLIGLREVTEDPVAQVYRTLKSRGDTTRTLEEYRAACGETPAK